MNERTHLTQDTFQDFDKYALFHRRVRVTYEAEGTTESRTFEGDIVGIGGETDSPNSITLKNLTGHDPAEDVGDDPFEDKRRDGVSVGFKNGKFVTLAPCFPERTSPCAGRNAQVELLPE